MKEIVPSPPAIVRNSAAAVQLLFQKNVIPSYARFEMALSHGSGSYLYDVAGRRYLDLGGGIAVCCLGHAHPAVTEALLEQSRKLVHVSNLYYTEPQGRLAEALVKLLGPGKLFFCNSGAEANEGLFKLARKFGHDTGRYEIITASDSFHGRTLAGIAATGQEKVKKGFEPMVAGFKQVPFKDLEAMGAAITTSTAAILIEAIQGERGITMATREYLFGLRELCDQHNLLLLLDEVQAGQFRTGKFHSWQTIVDAAPRRAFGEKRRDAASTFLPDGISIAKGLGGGFPIGAFWVREKFAALLSAGTHASTFGGTPLACAVALRILDVIERGDLGANARSIGKFLLDRLQDVQRKYPNVLRDVRGSGLMIGIEFNPKIAAIETVKRLHEKNLLTIPAATSVIRLLPPLNLSQSEANEGLRAIESVVVDLAKQ